MCNLKFFFVEVVVRFDANNKFHLGILGGSVTAVLVWFFLGMPIPVYGPVPLMPSAEVPVWGGGPFSDDEEERVESSLGALERYYGALELNPCDADARHVFLTYLLPYLEHRRRLQHYPQGAHTGSQAEEDIAALFQSAMENGYIRREDLIDPYKLFYPDDLHVSFACEDISEEVLEDENSYNYNEQAGPDDTGYEE